MKKFNALIYGFETDFCFNILKELKKYFKLNYVINSHKQISNMNMQKLIVNTELLNHELNKDILKNYDNFFKNDFIKFYRMIISRGINLKNLHEIKNEFAIYLHFFSNIFKKKKINLVILHSLPHQGPDYIIYILAKHFKIKIIMFYQTLFSNKFFILNDLKDFGKFEKIKNKVSLKREKKYSFEQLKSYEIDRYKDMVKSIHTINLSKSKKKTKLSHVIKKPIRDLLLKTKIINRIDYSKKYFSNLKNFIYKKNIEVLLKQKFVYFPLHDQPELTTSTLGGIYEDQVYALEKLRMLIDDNCNIIIKEHHFQSSFQRDDLFFKRLKKIKKLYMLPKDYPSNDLIKKCFFCSTIVGTSGWEALLEKKKSLVFGKAWYQKIDGCITYSDKLNKRKLKNLLKVRFNEKNFCNSYFKLRNKMFDGVIAPNYLYLLKNFNYKENSKNITKQLVSLLKN